MLWYYMLGGAAAFFATCAGLGFIWRGFRRFFRKLDFFFEDWYGRPAREGHSPQLGVIARLNHQDDVLAYLKAEVSFNHGGSLKDGVAQTKAALEIVQRDVAELKDHVKGDAQA